MKMTLLEYCESKKITIYRLSKITGVNKTQLFTIARDDKTNVRFETVMRIFNGTKEEFGKGLKPASYLSHDKYPWLK